MGPFFGRGSAGLCMIFEKEGRELQVEEFEKLTQAKWIPKLDFATMSVLFDIKNRGAKLYKKGEMTLEQIWFGKYYQKEIRTSHIPDIAIRWINPTLGWGVFALRNFKKMEFIAEYVGKVRKRKSADTKNGYCFEYILAHGFKTPYVIDAEEQGGVSRYINHSNAPNLHSSLATFDNISRVILYAKEPVAKSAQLCYDYGFDYWSKRTAPIAL